jgi:hypothetical protein
MKVKSLFRCVTAALAAGFAIAVLGCGLFSPLHPPDWIQGTWGGSSAGTEWEFTDNNAIWTASPTVFNFRQMSSPAMQVSDSETASTYSISWGSGGVSQVYTFERGDGSFITWVEMGIPLARQ